MMKLESKILRRISFLATIVALVTVFGAAGCKTAQHADESSGETTVGAADDNTMGDSDNGKAMGMQTVHFPYDSFVLDEEAKTILKNNAHIMTEKSGVKVQIEGHCDQRGGIQYNIALGEKRANAVKKFMTDLGIASDRVTTISYGKERLIDTGTTEAAYAKNRRANFAITAR